VKIFFPMEIHWMTHDHLPPEQARRALVRGPVVYAVDSLWWDVANTEPPSKVEDAVAYTPFSEKQITPEQAPAGLMGPALRAYLMADNGKLVQPLFIPFANVGVWYKPGTPKPDPNSRAYSYAVWLYAADTASFRQAAERARAMDEALRNAMDLVRIGDAASERAHQLQGESRSAIFKGRPFRHGKAFSYELTVPTDKPSDLVVTYWGGEQNKRVFDVLVNDRVLATQTLLQNKPNAFFEVRYRIPLAEVQGKTNALGKKTGPVRIGFRATSGTAGGVYGVRCEAVNVP
jgi:hypothetical protein